MIAISALVTTAAFIGGAVQTPERLRIDPVRTSHNNLSSDAVQWGPAALSSGVLGWTIETVDLTRHSEALLLWIGVFLTLYSLAVVLTNILEKEPKRIAAVSAICMLPAFCVGYAASRLAG